MNRLTPPHGRLGFSQSLEEALVAMEGTKFVEKKRAVKEGLKEHTLLTGSSRNQNGRKRTGRLHYWKGASRWITIMWDIAEPGTVGDQEEETVGIWEVVVGGGKEHEIVNSHQLWKE